MGSPSSFMPGPKHGGHYDLARLAISVLRKPESFQIKARNENQLEIYLVGLLKRRRALSPHIIDQIKTNPDKRISRVPAFGFDHGPDIAIDPNGTAIEVKLVRSAHDLRTGISQALVYRLGYRFAIMVLGDWTEHGVLVKSLLEKNSKGAELLRYLCDEHNVFTVIGPVAPDKPNLVFVSERSMEAGGKGEEPTTDQVTETSFPPSQAPSPTTIG